MVQIRNNSDDDQIILSIPLVFFENKGFKYDEPVTKNSEKDEKSTEYKQININTEKKEHTKL